MSRGRKPDAHAQRRKKDKAEITPLEMRAEIIEDDAEGLPMPPAVAESPYMSEMWRSVVGRGLVYEERDVPLIEQMVFDLETARQARQMCTAPDGRVLMMIGVGEPDENGVYLDSKPNPYLKVMREATTEALKIADQLGCTPLARARLGLTQAAGKAVTLSIAEAIDRAMERGR